MAAQAATELSRETGSEVHVIYALPTPAQLIGHHLYSDEIRESLIGGAEREAERFLKEQAERIESDGGKVAETHLRSGDPDKEILRTAEALEPALYNVYRKGRLPSGTYCRPLTAYRLLVLSAAAPSSF